MSEYRAAAIVEPGKIELVEKKLPVPGDGNVLIKIKACGICTLEKRLYTGKMKIFYPIIGGHEASGEIADPGDTRFRKGDRVVMDLLNRCGECHFCRTGHSNHCINQFKGRGGILSGFAEYIVIPSQEVYKIDEDVPFDYATLTEPLSDCIHSCMQAHLSPEYKVIIIGAGTMGLLHLLIMKRYSIWTVVTDIDDNKLDVARECGADFVINAREEDVTKRVKELTRGMGCNVVFVTAPGKNSHMMAFSVVSVMGTINFYAANYPAIEIPLNPNLLHYKEITLTGSESKTEKDFYQAVLFQNDMNIDLSPLISKKFPFTKIRDAMEAALDPSTYRVILEMENS